MLILIMCASYVQKFSRISRNSCAQKLCV
jgi:hypothetical protein